MKTKNFFALIVALFLFGACSSEPGMDEVKSIEKMISIVKKHVDKKYAITRIYVAEDGKLTNRLGIIIVDMYHDGKSYSFTISDDKPSEIKEKRSSISVDASKIKGIDLDTYDFKKLINYMEIAAEEIPKDEYVIRSVGLYTIDNLSGRGDITHSITLNVVEKEGSTKVQGRNIVTEYYEFKFDVDKDGTVEYRE